MEKKQSSIDWLVEQMIKEISKKFTVELTPIGLELIKQARAMHKQEHEDSYVEGSKCRYDGWTWNLEGIKEMANEHYNETFGQ